MSNRPPLVMITLGGLATLFIIGALSFVAIGSYSTVAWTGSRELDVHVSVVDASTLAPIANATVELVVSPYSRWEGLPAADDWEIEVIPLIGGIALSTGDNGIASFSHRFSAAGNDGLFSKTGYVDTRGVWLRVSCPGYVLTHLPIDRQSLRPRDIDDNSPIWVTVPLARD